MLIIIHGWSDTHSSFTKLGQRLVSEGVIQNVKHVHLGDYVSLDDDVTFDDLAHALQKAWTAQKIPKTPRSVDVIVHSTGGLVIRHWMTTFFRPSTNPIHRLLMLAPANFGSPLAHKGRSFIGRVVKGFKSDRLFHTGTHILNGLEVASPFSWELALRDRFVEEPWYGPSRMLCTVLVGTAGYSGIASAANEDGSDGTVYVSTANLNPAMVTLDFVNDPQKPTLKLDEPNGLTAFARIPDDNHSTLALKDRGPKNASAFALIRRAMEVTDQSWPSLVADLDQFSAGSRASGADRAFTQAYQNTVIRLSDNLGQFVQDYFLELFAKESKPGVADADRRVDDHLTRIIQETVFAKVHAYSGNPAYRSLLLNTTVLNEFVTSKRRDLSLSVTAMPDIRKTGTVGYSTFGYDDIGSIRLTPDRQKQFFHPDRTLMVRMMIKRLQSEKVFRILPLA